LTYHCLGGGALATWPYKLSPQNFSVFAQGVAPAPTPPPGYVYRRERKRQGRSSSI